MGGQIDWVAINMISEMLGVADVEALIRGVTLIREHFRRQDEKKQ